MEFTATYVESYHGKITAGVLLANPEENPDEPQVLSLMRGVEFEDTIYYVEINDQSNSSYGGIKSFVLHRDHLVMLLEDDLVEKLGEEDFRQVTVHFALDDEQFKDMRAKLRTVFDEYEVYSESGLED